MGIMALTLPISLSKLIPELNYMFNAVFLGHVGVKELAVVGITGVYYLVFSAIGYGLNNSILTIMSRRAGADNKEEIPSFLFHGLSIAFVIAFLFIAFTTFVIDDILILAGIEESEIVMSSTYLKIRIWGLLPLYAFQMCSGFIISIGKTRLLMFAALIGAMSNIFFDYSLIFGHFGFEQLGFNGAAYASIISEFLGFSMIVLLIIVFNVFKQNGFSIQWSFDLAKIKLIISQGLPLMSQYAISTLAWWFFFILISRNFDYETQALSQSMRNLFGLSGVFSWAFGSATNTIISNLIGQEKEDDVVKTIWKILAIAFTGMFILVLLLNAFPTRFLGLYGQPMSFITKAYGPLRIVYLAMLLCCFGVVWLNAVVATGKTKIVFLIEAVGIIVYMLYVYYVIEIFKLDINAAWMSEFAYWLVLMALSVWYIKSGKWKGNVI